MTRKLLPYEYQLIQQLGISKEEYIEFVAVQAAYNDPKVGTIFDTRNAPVVAVVLTVVGIIFQVASTLLRPRPQISAPRGVSVGPSPVAPPEQQGVGGQAQTREQRFSPRFGFNNAQDLAKYGDPVNLIYADTTTNPKGSVRAATSLLWSAVQSGGSTQFVRLLLSLGAGKIGAIDANKSAFGQTSIDDIVSQNKWIYFKQLDTGFLSWGKEVNNQYSTDPSFYGTELDNPYRLQPTDGAAYVDGFSQAYSPAAQNNFGFYGVVPINVLVFQRNSNGHKQSANLGIESSLAWTPLQQITQGTAITITIKSTKPDVDDINTQAQETRRALASAFDDSSIFKLGSALFRVQKINVGSPDEEDMNVQMVCIETGNAPKSAYVSVATQNEAAGIADNVKNSADYVNANKIVTNILAEDERYHVTQEADNDGGWIFGREAFTLSEIVNGSSRGSRFIGGDDYLSPELAGKSGIVKYKAPIYADSSDAFGNSRYVTLEDRILIEAGFWYFVRELTTEEKSAITLLSRLDTEINTSSKAGTFFYTKALARVETASYKTAQPCHIVDLAIKSRVFKRLSGRQERYGSDQVGGYPASDNGIKSRSALFLLKYKKTSEIGFTYVPGFFAVSRSAETDNFNALRFYSNLATKEYWQFKLEAVTDTQSEIAKHPELYPNGVASFFYIENSGLTITAGPFQFLGRKLTSATGVPPLNENPSYLQEWDLYNLDADNQIQFSFDSGPEFALTCVTEQQIDSFSNYPKLYDDISLIGLNLFSGRNLQDLRSFTAFVTKGRNSKRLRTISEYGVNWTENNFIASDGPTCYAADIFLDTVLDVNDGIGKYAKVEGIDMEQLARTKQFCIANKLFMDGIIADPTNWRGFWVQAATFSLLEFARIGGRETLMPAVPYNRDTGAMDRRVNVSALFNQGNIIEDSYKEEFIDYDANVQDLIASIVYRDTDANGTFSINRTIEVRLADTVETDSIRETFYVSQFVSTREQAILYGKFLCNIRRHVKTAIEFRTFPTQDPVSPGAFIYVDIGQNNWNGIRTGTIGPDGVLNVPLDNNIPNSNYKFLLYRSGNSVVSIETSVTNGTASELTSYEGWLFVLGTEVTSKRVFRVTEVQMDEEGEITVRGTNYPCTSDGLSEIANFDNAKFTVLGALD